MTFKILSVLGTVAILLDPAQGAVSGRVLDDADSRAVANALVQSLPSGETHLTDSEGRFDLSVSSIRPMQGSPQEPWQMTQQGRQVTFLARRALPLVAVDVVSLSGRALATVYRGPLPAGRTTWRLPGAPAPYGLLRVRIQGRTILSPIKRNAAGALRKPAAEPETLLVSRYGYAPSIQVLMGTEEVQVRLRKLTGEIVPPGMRSLAGGKFIMGANDGDSIERPAHEVEVDGFYLDSTEVTQGDFQALTGRRPWVYNLGLIRGAPPREHHPLHPAWGLNWYDAVLYCNARSKRDGLDTVYTYTLMVCNGDNNWCILEGVQSDLAKKGYRLPTEAEWEYACRAGTTTEFFWGASESDGADYAWSIETSGYSTHPVATKKPNAFGLYDMQGNISEWLEDWSRIDWPVDGSGVLITKNPVHTNMGGYFRHASRGSNYYETIADMRSSNRQGSRYLTLDTDSSCLYGFRAVKSK